METAAAAGAAKGRQGFSGLSAGEAWETRCVARPEPRVSAPGKVRDAGAGVWRGPGSRKSPAATLGALESPAVRTQSPPKCVPVPALRERRASRGKLAARVLGRPALIWAPREQGARCGGAGLRFAAASYWAPGPRSSTHSWPRFGGGKKRVDSFLMEKKKKKSGSGSRLSLPSSSPAFPADFVRGIRPSRNLRGRNAAQRRAGGRAEESSRVT